MLTVLIPIATFFVGFVAGMAFLTHRCWREFLQRTTVCSEAPLTLTIPAGATIAVGGPCTFDGHSTLDGSAHFTSNPTPPTGVTP